MDRIDPQMAAKTAFGLWRRDADSVREGSRAALTSSDSPTWDQQSPSDLWEEYEDGLMDGEDLELDLVEFAD